MRVCGVEIKGSEAILCVMEFNDGLFSLPDCRQSRFQLVHDQDQESFRKFQFSLAKLAQDYKISKFVVRERPQKGKFAGSAIGFKIEAALQLIADVETVVVSNVVLKDQLSRFPIPVDFKETGLKGFQEPAFNTAYAYLAK